MNQACPPREADRTDEVYMREKLLAAAAVSALLIAPAVAQTTDDTAPMTEAERQEMQRIFEGAGFTSVREIREGVCEVAASDGRTLIIPRGAGGGDRRGTGATGGEDTGTTTGGPTPANATEESPSGGTD